MSAARESILVVSCGNVMAGDDAFGPQVARQLRENPVDRVAVIDLDIRPLALLDHLANQPAVILVDAAVSPDWPPGTLLDLDWFDPRRPDVQHDDALSTHGLSIAHQIELAARLQLLPPVVRLVTVIIQPSRVGDKMSPEVRAAICRARDKIRERLKALDSQTRETCHA